MIVVVQSLSHVQLFATHGLQQTRTATNPVLHYLSEFAQIHVHWVDDVFQPSHPLLPSSPFAFDLSQHQGLFQWVSSSWSKYWSFSISPSNEYSGLIPFKIDCLISLQSKGLSRVFSSTTVQKYLQRSAFFRSNFYICPWLLEKP